jgi:hypothetical protein
MLGARYRSQLLRHGRTKVVNGCTGTIKVAVGAGFVAQDILILLPNDQTGDGKQYEYDGHLQDYTQIGRQTRTPLGQTFWFILFEPAQ